MANHKKKEPIFTEAETVTEAPKAEKATKTPANATKPLETAPKDGNPLMLSEDGENWEKCFWKKSRGYNAETRLWEQNGYWASYLTHTVLKWEPKFWEAA